MERVLARLASDVTMVYFTQETHCRHCRQEKALLMELADMASKLHVDVYNFAIDRQIAERYGVDKVPGTVLVGQRDYGVRYYGLPSGFECQPFMEDLVRVSEGKSGLESETKSALGAVTAPVRIEVFTQPACAFSAPAMRVAHQLAIESDHITADVVDVTDFPQLVEKYNILAAPTVVVNETYHFTGALDEERFVEHVLTAIRREG
jgi:glutaredoxin-like protein